MQQVVEEKERTGSKLQLHWAADDEGVSYRGGWMRSRGGS